jgi:hypothetical protein
MEKNKTCKSCRFFDPYADGAGECRRKAPVVKFVNRETKAAFPVVGTCDWCGDWEAENRPGEFGRMTQAKKDALGIQHD